MNNFTKSIIYSGLVLVAGMIAVIAIQNNLGPTATSFSALEPAAGEEAKAEPVSLQDAMKFKEDIQNAINAIEANKDTSE